MKYLSRVLVLFILLSLFISSCDVPIGILQKLGLTKGPNFCNSDLEITGYTVTCFQRQSYVDHTLQGVITNVASHGVKYASINLTITDHNITISCPIVVSDLDNLASQNFTCQFTAQKCLESLVITAETTTSESNCEYYNGDESNDIDQIELSDDAPQIIGGKVPEENDHAPAIVGGRITEDDDSQIISKEQFITKYGSWNCKPAPTMDQFWCEDYIKRFAGCEPPEPYCQDDILGFRLFTQEEGVYIDYNREIIEQLPRCYSQTELGEYVEYGKKLRIEGVVDWQDMKFYGLIKGIYGVYGGEWPEANPKTIDHIYQIFGELYPDDIKIHACVNINVNDGITTFNESLISSRSLCQQYFICEYFDNQPDYSP